MSWCGGFQHSPSPQETSALSEEATIDEPLSLFFRLGIFCSKKVEFCVDYINRLFIFHPKKMRLIFCLLSFVFAYAKLSGGHQAKADGLLNTINNNIAKDTSTFFAGGIALADALFGMVSFFVICTTLLNYLAEHRTGSGIGRVLLSTVMRLGIPYFFLKVSELLLPQWLSIATTWSQDITGNALAQPDTVATEGFTLAKSMLIDVGQKILNGANSTGFNVGTALEDLLMASVSIFGAIILLVTFTLLATEILIAQVQGYITISVGSFQLGFSASPRTSSWASAYYGMVMRVIVRLIIITAIITIGMNETSTWIQQIKSLGALDPNQFGSSIFTLLQIPMMGVIFLTITVVVTNIADAALSGQPIMSAGTAVLRSAERAGSMMASQASSASAAASAAKAASAARTAVAAAKAATRK